MKYSFTVWDKKIPTILAFVLVIVSIWTTSYLVQKGIISVGKAVSSSTPENITITNIKDASFTVSFSTNDKTQTTINYGEGEKLGLVALDDRDKEEKNQNIYYSHHITVSNLKPNTKYYFSILSGGNTYMDNAKNNSLFTTTTGLSIATTPSNQASISGKIVQPDGTQGDDTIVYTTIENAQSLSTLSTNTGEYVFLLNMTRSASLNEYVQVEQNSIINLEIVKQKMVSHIKILYKDENIIPPITLSKDYDFTKDTISEEENNVTIQSTLNVPRPSIIPGEIKILSPAENASLIDQKPVFRGAAVPGKTVTITIQSPQLIQTQIVADETGFWTFRPDTPLSAGKHTITIETVDKFGIIKKVTQAFTVFPLGSQVAEAATPSATPTATRIPTPPTPPPGSTITPTSSLTLTPTATRTPTPTIKPTGTTTSTPTPTTQQVGGAPTSTPTPTKTPTPTPTKIPTPTPKRIPTPLTTSALSGTPTVTITSVLTPTVTSTATIAANLTPTASITPAAPGDNTPTIIIGSISLSLIILGTILLFAL